MLKLDMAQTYDGRPISVLQDLIAKRMKILNEGRKDAVVATAITVLRSLRAATRQHRGKGVKVAHG